MLSTRASGMPRQKMRNSQQNRDKDLASRP
jgi:hypothetical protein